MSNDEINKYKDLYSQLVSAFTELHNHNLVFVKTKGRDSGFLSRRYLRNIETIAKELKRQGQLVCRENLANVRLEKKLKKEEKKNAKQRRTTKKSI